MEPVTLEGRLEVWFKGEWGTVCEDSFDDNAAAVVCRSIGLTGGAPLFQRGYGYNKRNHDDSKLTEMEVGRIASGPIWIDEIDCKGSEQDFLDCHRPLPLNAHDCNHHGDVFMKCNSVA